MSASDRKAATDSVREALSTLNQREQVIRGISDCSDRELVITQQFAIDNKTSKRR